MWWPLTGDDTGCVRIDAEPFRFEAVADDIESLNQRAEHGELEITALSCAQFARVQDRYALTACGASIGDGYGPKLVAARPMTPGDITDSSRIAIPGVRTSAFAALSLMLGGRCFEHEVVPFEHIIDAVAAGQFDAGLVIHEGQLTFEEAGLHLVADVGAWWGGHRGLPLPLGVNAIRRDLEERFGPGTLRLVTSLLRRSLDYALEHREESIRHALVHARGLDPARANAFVDMYVNRWTLDFGPRGREAVAVFLEEIAAAGLAPAPDRLHFVSGTPE